MNDVAALIPRCRRAAEATMAALTESGALHTALKDLSEDGLSREIWGRYRSCFETSRRAHNGLLSALAALEQATRALSLFAKEYAKELEEAE